MEDRKNVDAKSQDVRQAANMALIEVDKGLRSSNVGEQCEAIMKFPQLISQFPFPVLINTAFLKLADVFWSGPNVLREYVVQVTEQSKGHLCKVTDVAEVFRRISTVIFSNDPMARALTLSAFGSLASLVANQQKVLHSVYRGLDSHHPQEQEAAITAAVALCQYSRNFAAGVCDKIVSMSQAVTTPMVQKLKLLPILECLYYDLQTANVVRQVCIMLLSAYPSKHFTVVLLQTLTKLAIATCAQIPDQIALLMKVSATDERSVVRLAGRSQLKILAFSSPNMWSGNNVEDLMNMLKEKNFTTDDVQLMDAASLLSYSHVATSLLPAYGLMLSMCNHVEPCIASRACKTLCGLASASKEDYVIQLNEVRCIAENLLCTHSETLDEVSFKVLMSVFMNLARVDVLVEPSMHSLAESLVVLPGKLAVRSCWALTTVAARSKAVSQRVADRLLFALTNCAEMDKLLYPVSVVLLRMSVSEIKHLRSWNLLEVYCQESLYKHIFSMTATNRYFVMYQVAREASNLGFHRLASDIYLHLSQLVDSECGKSWLNALACIARAECTLHEGTVGTGNALSEGICMLQKAELHLQACNKVSDFSRHFLSTRVKYVITLTQLLTTCTTVFPGMSKTKNGCVHLNSQFKQSFQEFGDLALSYANLYSLSFDADRASLEYLKLHSLEESCIAMQSLLSALLERCGATEFSSSECMGIHEQYHSMPQLSIECNSFLVFRIVSQEISAIVKAYKLPDSFPGMESISQISRCTRALLKIPCLLPRYFFSSEQRTHVRLVTVPSIPDADESISLSCTENLSLTVEGVVEQKSLTGKYRKPKGVLLKIMQDLQQSNNATAKPGSSSHSTSQLKTVQGDYFRAQILMTFEVPGKHVVQIHTYLVDEMGQKWNTDETILFVVNSY